MLTIPFETHGYVIYSDISHEGLDFLPMQNGESCNLCLKTIEKL